MLCPPHRERRLSAFHRIVSIHGSDGDDYINGQGGSADTVAGGGWGDDDTVIGSASEIVEKFFFRTSWQDWTW